MSDSTRYTHLLERLVGEAPLNSGERDAFEQMLARRIDNYSFKQKRWIDRCCKKYFNEEDTETITQQVRFENCGITTTQEGVFVTVNGTMIGPPLTRTDATPIVQWVHKALPELMALAKHDGEEDPF